MVPGLLGMIALFNGMQGSLSLVYDREMGSDAAAADRARCRAAGCWRSNCRRQRAVLAQMLVFLLVAGLLGVEFEPPRLLATLLCCCWPPRCWPRSALMLSVHVRQLVNFGSR